MRYDLELIANLKSIKPQSEDRVNVLRDVDALHDQELILTREFQQVDIHDVSANENIERVVVVDFGDFIEYRVQLFSVNFYKITTYLHQIVSTVKQKQIMDFVNYSMSNTID